MAKVTTTFLAKNNTPDDTTVYDNDVSKSFKIIAHRHCDCGSVDTQKIVAITFDEESTAKILNYLNGSNS